jgi:glycosyltransferase involved in cell wall biosynthesis
MAYPGKGLSLLLKAIEILFKSHQLDIKLLIIGGGLSDLNTYIYEKKALARKLNIEDRIIWTGKIEEKKVSDLLKFSDVVVLPFSAGASDRRGSLLTALAHKKAVITTKPRIPIQHFKNMENMTWPSTREPDKLAKAIKQVLTDKHLKARLEYGASKLMQNYKWSEIGVQTHDFMKNVILNNF